MRPRSILVLLVALAALWTVQVPHLPAQVPTEEELKDLERQAKELEKKQAEAKRKAEAEQKAAAAAEAKREAARKKAEEERRAAEQEAKEAAYAGAAEAKRKAVQKRAEEERRAAEEARSVSQAASALAGDFVDMPDSTAFQMGCALGDGDCEDRERPVYTVSIKPFRMGKYEVTVGQFRRFVEAAGYRTDAERGGTCYGLRGDGQWGQWAKQAGRNWKKPGFPQTDRHPVVCVSWNDAEAYAQWLSRQGGGRYRLPSESEWEYAARAGSRARYSFGDSEAMLCQYGNVADRTAQQRFNDAIVASCDDAALYTAPVGSYRPNRFGLHDTHGNVWEWTGDCYHVSYAGAPADGAVWTAGDCAQRVVRGGSWYVNPGHLRSASRGWSVPADRDNSVGFRLAQDR